VIASIVIYDSARLGFRWGDDGPQAGYFPFYIGVILGATSLMLALRAMRVNLAASFVSKAQLRLVLSVLVPLAVYVVLVGLVGLYVSSIVFIAFFMRTQGSYSWFTTLLVSAGVMVVIFVVFEFWFQVPLLKGPIESFLKLA
jgi:hypothetical protein